MGRQLLTHTNERDGASEVLGVVLLFGLVLTAAMFVFISGSATITDIQDKTELTSAERNLETVNTELRSVSETRGNATADLQFGSADPNDVRTVNGTEIRIVATYEDGSTNTETVDLDAVVYSHGDDTKIVSQSGGVWRLSQTGITTVSSPSLEYEDGELDFDIIDTSGPADAVDGRIRARRNAPNSTDRTEELYSELLRNDKRRLPRTIRFEVSGPYEDAWQQYFQSEYGDDPQVPVGDDAASVEFKLISSVESGTPTGSPAYSVSEFGNRPSQHVFEYTVGSGVGTGDRPDGNWDRIVIDYQGDPDLSHLMTGSGPQGSLDVDGAVRSIGVDTTNSGYLDTTSEPEAVIANSTVIDTPGQSRIVLDLDGDALPPIDSGHTIMLRYGVLEDDNRAPVINPAPDEGTINVTIDSTRGTREIGTEIDLRSAPAPLVEENRELLINGESAELDHLGTAFERKQEGEKQGVDVVVVSDESGSMNVNDPNQLRPEATNSFIDKLAEDNRETGADHRVARIHFSGNCFQANKDSSLRQDFSDPKTVQAKTQPPDQRKNCFTNYHAGLKRALDTFADRRPENQDRNKVIVFLGDGRHNAGSQYRGTSRYEFDTVPSRGNALALSREAGERDITIHTIGFATGNVPQAEQLLKSMKNNTGGSFSRAERATDLEAVFDDVAERVERAGGTVDRNQLSASLRLDGSEYTFDPESGRLRRGPGTPETNRPLVAPEEPLEDQSVPNGETLSKREIINGESLRLSLTVKDHGCDRGGAFEPTPEDRPIGNPEFDLRLCEATEAAPERITPADGDQYTVYTAVNDSESIPSVDLGAWQPSLEKTLREEGYAANGQLQIAEDESLIVVTPGPDDPLLRGYVVFAVSVDDVPEPQSNAEVLAPGDDRLFSISVQEVSLEE
jgi:Mg-chelatase subunit ChlD